MLIPKIMHQVWIGESIPEDDLVMCESLREHHPDWDFILWSNEITEGPWTEIRRLPGTCVQRAIETIQRKAANSEVIPAALSDIYRLDVLYEHGGLYVDTDVFAYKNFDRAMRGVELGIPFEFSQRTVGNFMIAATRSHPALMRALNEANLRVIEGLRRNSLVQPVTQTGPYLLADVWSNRLDLHVWPMQWFSCWRGDVEFSTEYEPDFEAFGVHAFSGKWRQDLEKRPFDPSKGEHTAW